MATTTTQTAAPELRPPYPVFQRPNADVEGDNVATLMSQIAEKNEDQVMGLGGTPSVHEAGDFKISEIYQDLMTTVTQAMPSGDFSHKKDQRLGNAKEGDYHSTYVSGDVHVSGKVEGAGILLIDGNLEITGKFEFQGIVVVNGDIRLSGGGAGIHVYGSVFVGQSLTAIDTDVTISGNADIQYSLTGHGQPSRHFSRANASTRRSTTRRNKVHAKRARARKGTVSFLRCHLRPLPPMR